MTHASVSCARRKSVTSRLVAFFIAASLSAPAIVAGQRPQKRPLTHNDYDGWRLIQAQTLSSDGKFVAYALAPEDGDGEVVVRNLETGKEWRAPRGAMPTTVPQINPFSETPGPPPQPGRVQFTADSRFVVYQTMPTKSETARARKEKKKAEEMPKNGLGILDVASGTVNRVDRVKSFQVPEEGSGYVAYLLEPKAEEKKPEDKKDEQRAEQRPESAASTSASSAKKEKKKEYGSDLILKGLNDGTERTFADVTEYSLSKDARTLAFAVASRKDDTNGLYVVNPGSADAQVALLKGKGKYTRIAWDEKQRELAFLSDRDDSSSPQPRLKVYGWDRKSTTPIELASIASPGFRDGWVISDKGPITFSQDGARVFFGTAPATEPEKEDEDSSPDDKVIADLWSWQDDYIQPMQKVRAEIEKNRSYRASVGVADKKFVQLADLTMPGLTVSSNGSAAIGTDDRPYRRMVGYEDDSNAADLYLVNVSDGSRRLLRKRQPQPATISPSGSYILFYDGKDWSTISAADGKVVNLTSKLGVSFAREDHDSPSTIPAYGVAGWTAGDKDVLIYDRFDIWRFAPDGSLAKNLTNGLGRQDKTALRYVRLEQQEKFIDPAKPLLLHAENEVTRDSGFYRVRLDGGAPDKLVMAAKYFSTPSKAKGAEVFLLTASTFTEFPDLLVTGPSFNELKKISDANPQKAELLWGTAELMRYKNTDGVELSAMLIKPEGFDPARKYPLMVYIYEKLSEGVNRFVDPRPSHSINASYYASNGYLVLMPDIVYTIGYPGQSALKCVLPAIQSVVDRGFVDEKAIGIQGHSWGGYQIAYMITQTNRFRAAAAGAPVANMTSAYSGIRWGTGLPRQFQYEHQQSRIGGTLWEKPTLFLENSAVFRADRVQTPLLMIHNDNDDAVPWYQGIEYFLALRRLGKEVYMFNYNGEPHGLRRRANQKDYTMRLQQFFDHFLKGAPAPEWMVKGIPYLDREREKEKNRTVVDAKEKAQRLHTESNR